MASIRKEILVDAKADEVWAAIRDFGAVQRLFPGILVNVRAEQDGRTVTFADGTVVRERLVDVDDGARRLVYAAVGGRTTHHNSSLQVVVEGDAKTRVIWITDLLPDELASRVAALVEHGATAMKRALEAGRR